MGGSRTGRTAARVAVLTLVAAALLAGSVQAVTMLAGMPSAVRDAPDVRGYVYGEADASQSAAALLLDESADRLIGVVGFGQTDGYADTYGPGFERGVGFVAAFGTTCIDDALVTREVYPEEASYKPKALKTAVITSTGPLHGYEYRVPGCDDPQWDREVDTDLGRVDGISLDVTITGQGRRTPYLDTGHASSFPGCAFAGQDAGVTRDGVAQVTLSKDWGGFVLDGLTTVGAGLAAGGGSYAESDVGTCWGLLSAGLRSRDHAVHPRALMTLVRRWARRR